MTTDDWHNPYFAEVAGGVTVGSDRAGFSPQHLDIKKRRKELVQEYAWAIPNEDAIETIAEYDPILEVASGKGYWAYLLRQLDVDILATDIDPSLGDDAWTTLWKADARDVVTDYPDRTLLLVWPQGMWSVEALGAFNGDTVVYVGECRGGCCAPDRFHQMLYDDWRLVETVDIPRYLGIKDRLEVWERQR